MNVNSNKSGFKFFTYDEKPSIDMIAKYRPAESPELVVELWEEGKGFELHLTFEFGYMLDLQHRDSLVPGIRRVRIESSAHDVTGSVATAANAAPFARNSLRLISSELDK